MSKTGSLIRNYGFSIVSSAIALGLSLVTQALGIEKLGFPLFLATVAMTVWYAGNGPGVLAIVLSTLSYDYFFAPPFHTFGVEQADRPYIVGFVLFGLITAGFSSRRRTIEQNLRRARDALAAEVIERTRQASLLDLTHDPIFVRDMRDVITYWNRGAQELFGWAASDANKELEAFAYSTSHDLRAPLRHIAGYTELLQKNAAAVLDDKCRRYVLMILESTSRMGTLIDDLLAFSRIGRVQTQNTLVSMMQIASAST